MRVPVDIHVVFYYMDIMWPGHLATVLLHERWPDTRVIDARNKSLAFDVRVYRHTT